VYVCNGSTWELQLPLCVGAAMIAAGRQPGRQVVNSGGAQWHTETLLVHTAAAAADTHNAGAQCPSDCLI
jgi:hypothetical protein